jgi:hypothetical protein
MQVERLFATGALTATKRRRPVPFHAIEWWAIGLAVILAGAVTALGLVW